VSDLPKLIIYSEICRNFCFCWLLGKRRFLWKI